MNTSIKTVWGSILCGIGAITIITSVTMYFDHRDEVATINMMESLTNGFNRDLEKISGVSMRSLDMNLRSNPGIKNAISSSRARIILVLLAGIAMSGGGSWLLIKANKEN